MNSGISEKIIFLSFISVNFLQPVKCSEIHKYNNGNKIEVLPQGFLKKFDNKKPYNSTLINNFTSFPIRSLLEKNSETLIAELSEKKEELIIQADKQSELKNVINAEGNVSLSYKGKLLKADSLIYNKSNKKISARGNIVLKFGDQLFY